MSPPSVKARARTAARAALIGAMTWTLDGFGVCYRPPEVWVAVRMGSPFPRNGRIVIVHPTAHPTVVPMRGKNGLSGPHARLRTAPSKGMPARDIAVSEGSRSTGIRTTIKVVPTDVLPPRTRFEIWLDSVLLGTFVTDDTIDQKSPNWAGVKSAYAEPAEGEWKGVRWVPGECGATLSITFFGSRAFDEHDAAPLYGVWLARTRKDLDDSQLPVEFMRGRADVRAEAISMAHAQDALDALGLPKGKPQKIWARLRAIDYAGNRSQPSDVEVELPPLR